MGTRSITGTTTGLSFQALHLYLPNPTAFIALHISHCICIIQHEHKSIRSDKGIVFFPQKIFEIFKVF